MVSNAFEKSARIISVTSPLFIALIMSSLILKSTVVVEWPFLKPDMLSLNKSCESIKDTTCSWTSHLSNTFDSTGKMDMGLISDSVAILSFFDIGVILAIFHTSGKDEISIKVLLIWVSGPAEGCPIYPHYNGP